MKTVSNNPQLQVDLILQDHNMTLEVGTEAGDNFLSIDKWRKLGSLALKLTSALRVSTRVDTKLHSQQHEKKLQFVVSNISNLNLLGRERIRQNLSSWTNAWSDNPKNPATQTKWKSASSVPKTIQKNTTVLWLLYQVSFLMENRSEPRLIHYFHHLLT